MHVCRASQVAWKENALPHRKGRISFKPLIEGQEGTADNFGLILADESADFYSPCHCHPWDQIRLCLRGEVPIAPGLGLAAGEVGYFPEGVVYGPQDGTVNRLVLVLQFGGASGQGYLSEAQLRRGRDELRDVGQFADGMFQRDDDNGQPLDGYAAVWEQVTGVTMSIPPARFKGPLLMDPAAFAWRDIAQGVHEKPLGRFTERQVDIGFVAMESETPYHVTNSADAQHILFICAGGGAHTAGVYEELTAIHLEPGEEITFKATVPTELFSVVLPLIR